MMNVKEFKHILLLLLLGCCLLGLMAVAVRQQETSLGEELKPILTEATYLKNKTNKQDLPAFVKRQKKRNKQVQKQLKQYLSKKKKHSKRKKSAASPNRTSGYGEKSQLTAFLLCVILGIFGAHRFYTGQAGWGILHLCSLGCCGIFVIIDMVLIIAGKITTKEGHGLIPWWCLMC